MFQLYTPMFLSVYVCKLFLLWDLSLKSQCLIDQNQTSHHLVLFLSSHLYYALLLWITHEQILTQPSNCLLDQTLLSWDCSWQLLISASPSHWQRLWSLSKRPSPFGLHSWYLLELRFSSLSLSLFFFPFVWLVGWMLVPDQGLNWSPAVKVPESSALNHQEIPWNSDSLITHRWTKNLAYLFHYFIYLHMSLSCTWHETKQYD